MVGSPPDLGRGGGRYRVGAPWRDLPAEFGPWQTVWKRHHRWSLDGTYAKIFLAVQESFGPRPDNGAGEDVDVGRLDQHPRPPACRRGPSSLTAAASRGARPNYTIPWPEPDDHALGRSRGGFTTKIPALVDHRMRPVVVRLTAGQAGDNPQLVPLLDDWAQQRPAGPSAPGPALGRQGLLPPLDPSGAAPPADTQHHPRTR